MMLLFKIVLWFVRTP